MTYLADLHVHSRFSRATSAKCTLEEFHYWAQIKSVRVVGTGDFTHPDWYAELVDKLQPAEPGLFRLRDDVAASIDRRVPKSCQAPVRFMLTGEISSIYTRGGRCRKVHTLVHCPDFSSATTIRNRLDRLGNIRSDGRPILGLDPRDLLQIVLDAHSDAYLIPAHIWTPWFSMLGSKSGFDSVTECFGSLTCHIFAVETGLSSDPPMNRRVSFLDPFSLVSNSDLHSPRNMARNATEFHGNPDYFAIKRGLQEPQSGLLAGTIDLFPEEGKYYLDGHRKCNVFRSPERTRDENNLCPVCGRPLVLGVLNRVTALADRLPGSEPKTQHTCLIGLAEILSELLGCGPNTKKVQTAYASLIERFGPELFLLRHADPSAMSTGRTLPLLPEALIRLRNGHVRRTGGYDGVFGTIRLFQPDELDSTPKGSPASGQN